MAANILFCAKADLENLVVGDFGCGTGMLGIGSTFIGSAQVIGIDIDKNALDTAWLNSKKLEVLDIDFMLSDMTTLSLSSGT